MNKNNAGAYVIIAFAIIGMLVMANDIKTFDVGTMDTPNVISLRP